MQELAASVFSMVIAFMHAHGLRGLRAGCGALAVGGAPPYPYLPLLTVHALLNLNGWVWSTVFHARCERLLPPVSSREAPTRLTERLEAASPRHTPPEQFPRGKMYVLSQVFDSSDPTCA
jgi:hypothetical protein